MKSFRVELTILNVLNDKQVKRYSSKHLYVSKVRLQVTYVKENRDPTTGFRILSLNSFVHNGTGREPIEKVRV